MNATGPSDGRQLPCIGAFAPEVNGEKCLLARAAFSKCRACADACPAGAILCDRDGLGINQEACLGCGLCVPVCPEAAIASPFEPQLRDYQGTKAVFVACEMVLSQDAPDHGRDRIPCLHMLGLRELEVVRRKGADVVIAACGDCAACVPVNGRRIAETALVFRTMLASRNIDALEVRVVEISGWHGLRQQTELLSPGRVVGRRGFLQLLSRPLNTTLGQEQEQAGAFGIPIRSANDVVAYRPIIDVEKCVGCDACVKVCPHGAIAPSKTGEEDIYTIDAFACTGCKLCVDICDEGAVGVAGLGPPEQTRISLVSFRCKQCGVLGHLPAGRLAPQLCWICARLDRRQRLFQVNG